MRKRRTRKGKIGSMDNERVGGLILKAEHVIIILILYT